MSSSVFFKFKSQREPSRVAFDGTGISVFELKRHIILTSKLGDGTDFELKIFAQDTNEEYDNDTTIIPRSTSVIARRIPASKPGRGTAARYVNGKMPAVPNASRREKNGGHSTPMAAPKKPENAPPTTQTVSLEGLSEEDKINAMFQVQNEQWKQTQESLINQAPVHRGGPGGAKKAAQAPAHSTPPGYVCYRCGEKGHWIQACPTNADPNYDGRPRVKRTTGIPRSFLKTVEKPAASAADDNPNASVMVNADGEYVVAMPDQSSWETYKKKASAQTSSKDEPRDKELAERQIECPMCHKLLRDAVKTPCCDNVYCEECIHMALLGSDFVCPTCETKDVFLERVLPDSEARERVQEYKNEKNGVKAEPKPDVKKEQASAESPRSPHEKPAAVTTTATAATPASTAMPATSSPTAQKKSPVAAASSTPPVAGALTATAAPTPSAPSSGTKRKAEDSIVPDAPRGPAAMRNAQAAQQPQRPQPITSTAAPYNNAYNAPMMGNGYNSMPFSHQLQMPKQQPMMQQANFGYGGMGMGGMGGGMNMGMGGMGGMGMGMGADMYGMGMGGMGWGNPAMGMGMGMGGMGMGNQQMGAGYYGGGGNGVQQQQHMGGGGGGFATPFNNEDSPYMRQPVNPHRHVSKTRVRPSDFKAVGGSMS